MTTSRSSTIAWAMPLPIWYHWKEYWYAMMCRLVVASFGPPSVVA